MFTASFDFSVSLLLLSAVISKAERNLTSSECLASLSAIAYAKTFSWSCLKCSYNYRVHIYCHPLPLTLWYLVLGVAFPENHPACCSASCPPLSPPLLPSVGELTPSSCGPARAFPRLISNWLLREKWFLNHLFIIWGHLRSEPVSAFPWRLSMLFNLLIWSGVSVSLEKSL